MLSAIFLRRDGLRTFSARVSTHRVRYWACSRAVIAVAAWNHWHGTVLPVKTVRKVVARVNRISLHGEQDIGSLNLDRTGNALSVKNRSQEPAACIADGKFFRALKLLL